MMKKIWTAWIVAMMLVAVAACASAKTMYVDTPNHRALNLRNADDEVIAQIPYRTALEIYERSYIDSERVIVEYKGREGYVYLRYLSSKRPAASGSSSGSSSSTGKSSSGKETKVFDGMKQVSPYTVSVCPSTPTGFVNLRWAPSKSASIQSVRYSGDTLTVLAENTYWAQVYDAETRTCGFMLKKFLKSMGGVEG